MERISAISAHMSSNPGLLASLTEKSPNDVVICSALRTCLSKAKRGPLKDTSPETMISEVLKAMIRETKVDPALVEDLVMGNVLQPGGGAAQTRMAQILAGFPIESSAVAINRLCSSGIESVSMVAAKIKAGVIDCGIAGGVEQMSMYNLPDGRYPKMSAEALKNDWVQRTYVPDGVTSENVVEKYGQTRAELDQYAVNSHLKAAHAQKMGYFKDEIVPIKAKTTDKDGNEKEELADTDNGNFLTPNPYSQNWPPLFPSNKKILILTRNQS
jgi:acetyl-CoA acyltransferase 1